MSLPESISDFTLIKTKMKVAAIKIVPTLTCAIINANKIDTTTEIILYTNTSSFSLHIQQAKSDIRHNTADSSNARFGGRKNRKTVKLTGINIKHSSTLVTAIIPNTY